MSDTKHRGRILAMQALCQWDVHHDESHESLQDLMASRRASDAARAYATELVLSFWKSRDERDRLIESVAKNWKLSRISSVERNVLRVAVLEMLAGAVPPRVAITEAIEIGREYGGADSPRFINGILDAVWKAISGRRESNE